MSSAVEPEAVRTAAPPRGMVWMSASWRGTLGTVLPPLVTLALILALWQALILAFDLKPYLVPEPLERCCRPSGCTGTTSGRRCSPP